MAELKYWIWLSKRRGLGAAAMNKLIQYFDTPENIYYAAEKDYLNVLKKPVTSLCDKALDESLKIMEECSDKDIGIMTLSDARYPERLKNIFDPPVVLYIRGKLPNVDDEITIAIVGTRSFTPYGAISAERMGYEIAKGGGIVVTGLAAGIDSSAARGALKGGGRVVGVLGCGADVVYPRDNVELFESVMRTGAILTEYPPRTSPNAKNFPARNRIVSGVSLGVLVIEAPERSGALITASRALEQGRDVFVVPGNIDAPSCKGSNALLKEGAIIATCGKDVLNEYKYMFPDKYRENDEEYEFSPDSEEMLVDDQLENSGVEKKIFDNDKERDYIDPIVDPVDLSEEELCVIRSISEKSMHIDDIIAKCDLPTGVVLSTLTMLELRGAVTQEPGKRFTSHVYLK